MLSSRVQARAINNSWQKRATQQQMDLHDRHGIGLEGCVVYIVSYCYVHEQHSCNHIVTYLLVMRSVRRHMHHEAAGLLPVKDTSWGKVITITSDRGPRFTSSQSI